MGWDVESGVPTPSTLERLGLKDVAEGLGESHETGPEGLTNGSELLHPLVP